MENDARYELLKSLNSFYILPQTEFGLNQVIVEHLLPATRHPHPHPIDKTSRPVQVRIYGSCIELAIVVRKRSVQQTFSS